MKKIGVLLFLLHLQVSAQLPVSILPQNKKAVIEHFTAVGCGYSPEGDSILSAMSFSNPGKIVAINIHQGSWASLPQVTQDFTTTSGNSIAVMPGMGISGYPSADFNRTIVTGSAMSTATRTLWASYASSVISQPAYCNVAVQGTVNATTRVLTVEAQVYYTGNSPVSTNSLTVMLLEDSIHGPTEDWGNYNPANYNQDGSYNHNNVLRASVSPVFGTSINTTSVGSTYSTTLTYTIPITYGFAGKSTQCLLGRLKLAAFVTETNSLTINGAYGPIYLQNFANAFDIAPYGIVTDAFVCAGKLNSSVSIINYGSTPLTSAVLSYTINGGAPVNFTYTGNPVNPMTSSSSFSLPLISFSPLPTNTLGVNVVSINGNLDQNNFNDVISKTVNATGINANSINMQMNFLQDRYGAEIGWFLVDESSGLAVPGASVATGTYSNLASNGTLLHSYNFTINASSCYKLIVTDSYGDGINSGSGVGGYTLSSGGSAIVNSNGQYKKGETNWIRSSLTAGITHHTTNKRIIDFYPNPASSSTNLRIEVLESEIIGVNVFNEVGQKLHSETSSLQEGINTLTLITENWTSGIYNVVVTSRYGNESCKLAIIK